MSERPPAPPAVQTASTEPGPTAGSVDVAPVVGPGAGHPAPPVFSFAAFALVVAGVLGAVIAAPVAAALFGDRLALPNALAIGLAAVVGAAVAGLLGAGAAL